MLSKVITHPGQIFVHILESRDKQREDREWKERGSREREGAEREERKNCRLYLLSLINYI